MKNKIILLLIALSTISCSIKQNIASLLPNSSKLKDRQIESNNINEIRKEAFNRYNLDLSNESQLYSIRGIDITTRDVQGRIWNEKLNIYYHYNQIDGFLKSGRIDTICYKSDLPTINFNPIVNSIELEDWNKVKNYASKYQVLSGWNWKIKILERLDDGEYITKGIDVSDFLEM